MFVSTLYTDKWTGNKNEENFIENPNWNQIETAIRELDGKTKTLVSLEADDESYMMIGGGESGKYIVTATLDRINYVLLFLDSNRIRNLASRRTLQFTQISRYSARRKRLVERPETIQNLVVGGQAGKYPAIMCVDLRYCLVAAKTFTQSGKLNKYLSWKKDKSLVMA